MAFVEWDEKVEALAPDGSDQPFAIRIRFGRADRRFQNPDAEALQLGITGRENRIAVVEDESVWMIERQKLAELLNRPLGSGMAGHVHIENAPRTDFHGNEDIQDAERCSYRHEKIAGYDPLRVVTDEGCPTLVGASAWIAALQILADRSRRNSNAQLQR